MASAHANRSSQAWLRSGGRQQPNRAASTSKPSSRSQSQKHVKTTDFPDQSGSDVVLKAGSLGTQLQAEDTAEQRLEGRGPERR